MRRRDDTTRGAVRGAALGAAVLVTVLAAGCAGAPERAGRSTPTPDARPTPVTASTSPAPTPSATPPPTGRLTAELRQSSLDAAAGQLQAWVLNDTARDVLPTALRLRDPRWPTAVPGARLRSIPSGSERGYPFRYPDEVRCAGPARGRPSLVVTLEGGRRSTVRVADPIGLVAAYVRGRCDALAVAAVARLSWSPRTTAEPGTGTGLMRLVVAPTGGPGRLRIVRIGGTPVLTPATGPVWRPDLVVDAGSRRRVVTLPVRPARCDPHVFAESAGATAFRVGYRLDGEAGEIVLRMGESAARRTLAYAVDACDL